VTTDFPKENQGVIQALINPDSLRNPLVTIDGEKGIKIRRQVFVAERMGIEKDSSEADEHTRGRCLLAVSDQNLVSEVQNRRSSFNDLPRAARPPLTSGPQAEAFLQKYPFASARIIAKRFLRAASAVKEIIQRELGMRRFSRRWVPHSMSDAQKVARVEAAKEMLKISQEPEKNDFDGIAAGDESWFQHTTAPSKMFARLTAVVIPRTQQAVGAKNYDHGSSP
jgi:hypothetical protein